MESSPDNPLTFATPMDAIVARLASNQLHVTAEFMGFSEGKYCSSKALVRQREAPTFNIADCRS